MKRNYAVFVLILLIIVPAIASEAHDSGFISFYYGDYDKSLLEECRNIPVVAAITDRAGLVGSIRICLLNTENNMIVLDSKTAVDETTIESIADAVGYAEKKTGIKKDFFISFDLNSESVSGKSTGASIALGMIALLEDKYYDPDFIITGSIGKDGSLSEAGGLWIKIMSVSNTPVNNIIVAKGQRTLTVYEQHNNRLLAKSLDLFEYSKGLGINYIEISNIEEGAVLALNEKV